MTATLADTRTQVVILGGGPAGLTAAIALGRQGVECVVLERRAGTSDHPRGHVENGRTMELFRLWGVEDEVRSVGVPRDFLKSVTFVTRVSGIELGRVDFDENSEWLMTDKGAGPAPLSSTPQDRLEPVLLRAAEATGNATVHFGVTIGSVEQNDEKVTVSVTGQDGQPHIITADYCIAADGPRSQTRESLGIEMDGPGTLGTQLGIYFHADMSKYTKANPNILYWVYNTDAQGVIISLDGDTRWHMLSAYDADSVPFEEFTEERVTEIVRAAIGDPDIDIEIRSILPWRMRAAVAQTTKVGRIFLAGDAAHTMPPTGGMGMNTAIGDTHNLAWKIRAVLSGYAGPELLDTYQVERLPVGTRNTFNSLENAKTMMETGLAGILVNDPEGFANIEAPSGASLRATLGEAASRQHDHFSFDGLSFGYTYEQGAVVPWPGAERAWARSSGRWRSWSCHRGLRCSRGCHWSSRDSSPTDQCPPTPSAMDGVSCRY